MFYSDPNCWDFTQVITITPEQIDATTDNPTRLQLTQELMRQENNGTIYVAFLVPLINAPHGFVDNLTQHLQHPNEPIPPMDIRSFYFSALHGLRFYSYADLKCECLALARYDPDRNHRKSLHRHTSAYCFEAKVRVLESTYHHMADVRYPSDCELFRPGQCIDIRLTTIKSIFLADYPLDPSWGGMTSHRHFGYMTACNQFYNYIPPKFAENDGFPSQELFDLCTNSSVIVNVT